MLGVSREVMSGGGDEKEVRGSDQAKDKVVSNSHHMRCGMFLEAGLIFMQGHIAWVMQSTFDPQ